MFAQPSVYLICILPMFESLFNSIHWWDAARMTHAVTVTKFACVEIKTRSTMHKVRAQPSMMNYFTGWGCAIYHDHKTDQISGLLLIAVQQ